MSIRLWLYVQDVLGRLRRACRTHWRRLLAGAAIGWLLSVVGGAVLLYTLERSGWISFATSDELGIVLPLAGTAGGALLFWALRPRV